MLSILKPPKPQVRGEVPKPIHRDMADLDSEQVPERKAPDLSARETAMKKYWRRERWERRQEYPARQPKLRFGPLQVREFEHTEPPCGLSAPTETLALPSGPTPMEPRLVQAVRNIHLAAMQEEPRIDARDHLLKEAGPHYARFKKLAQTIVQDIISRCHSRSRRVAYRFIFRSFVRREASVNALKRASSLIRKAFE